MDEYNEPCVHGYEVDLLILSDVSVKLNQKIEIHFQYYIVQYFSTTYSKTHVL